MSVQIKGANEHNLHNIDVEFGDGLTVVTGISGSGKTSLVFDTLYHEARRRFLEIFSAGATGLRLSPANVQSISGLGPAVAVGQNLLNRNPNSTLATASGLHPFLRLLYARLGERYCPNCGTELSVLSEDEIIEWLITKSKEASLTVFAPILRGVHGSHRTLLEVLTSEFDTRQILVDGHPWDHQNLDPGKSHDIEIEIGCVSEIVSVKDIRQMVHRAWELGTNALVVRKASGSPPPNLLTRVGFSALLPERERQFPSQEGNLAASPHDTQNKLPQERRTIKSAAITIRDARAHNLKGVDVDFPKAALTVVTGVSGSGKSSLVVDVLEAEARRRFLETLSLYERQSTREGPEAPVESVTGLGVAVSIAPERRLYNRRATVATATEIAHHLAVLFAWLGKRQCPQCHAEMQRITTRREGQSWLCPECQNQGTVAQPRHFSPTTYAAACLTCHGVGTLQIPKPEKLIIHPEQPLCAGAMYSPGFFPRGYLGKPFNHGYDMVQALAGRYGFDPMITPWDQMTSEAQQAFLFGDPAPMEVLFQSRTRTFTRTATFPGFYTWIGDWDVGGTYTDTQACPDCLGARLRPEYLAVRLEGYNIHQLSEMPLSHLFQVSQEVSLPEMDKNSHLQVIETSLSTIIRRLRFLLQVGLGYLHLNRVTSTLSAGEAQRIKLAGLLGSGLTSLTILLDEPSRGLHPSEVEALLGALIELRDEKNTVIVIEHDPVIIQAADYLLDVGPGAGVAGGEIVAQGTPEQVAQTDSMTARWLRGERRVEIGGLRRIPRGWLTIRGAKENNLQGADVSFPLGALVGLCGVSGSGKSTLLIDTLGRALAPKKHTTSVASEPLEPGVHKGIENAPGRTIIVDQTRGGVVNPAAFLNLDKPLRKLYTASEDAQALGISEQQLSRGCSVCKGRGTIKIDMGFLPAIHTPCETCRATGLLPEAWEIHLRGLAFPELFGLTIDEVYERFGDVQTLARSLAVVRDVGLGYLVLRQPGYTLSGGETQRLKIARELCRKTSTGTLYILDEPTIGQHLEDVAHLNGVLHKLVDAGHTVFVIEHHPHLVGSL